MKLWRSFLLVCSLLVATLGGAAKVPPLTGRVVDTAGVLSAQEIAQLTQDIQALEEKTGGQLAVCIENHIPEDSSLEDRSLEIATTWGIGHKEHDNGALLYLAMGDRRSRLEIGYGWEGWVNDARAGDILRAMGPLLQQGKTADAIRLAVGQVAHFVEERIPVPPPKEPLSPLAKLIIAGVVVVIAMLCFLSLDERRRDQFVLFLLIYQLMQFILLMLMHGGGRGGRGGGGGGFSGGGGSFGGGGASGRW
jgi:uncharacterized protein